MLVAAPKFKSQVTMEFFQFDALEDAKASLAGLVRRFEESKVVVEIGRCLSGSLHCRYRSQLEFTPQDATIAMQRCVLMMKQYGDSEEAVVDNCAKLMAHLCGQGTRPNTRWLVRFEGEAGELEVVLPEFASADVGFRLWAGSVLLARLIFDGDEALGSSPLVVELGAGSGLCALASLMRPHPADEVVITDFNQACLRAASESAARFGAKAKVLFMDWTKDPGQVAGVRWQGAAVVGATIVYEDRHAEEIYQLLHVLFTRFDIHSAAIAVHRAHSGYDRFYSLALPSAFFASLRLYQVGDDIGAHEVGVFCFQV